MTDSQDKHTDVRSYKITADDNFTVSSVALLSSIELKSEEICGITLDLPPYSLFINGIKIPSTFYNNENKENFYDFAYMREKLRKIDPYEEDEYMENLAEEENININQLYLLEKTLEQGSLDALEAYKYLSEEEMNSSVFTPYAIIRFESDENYVVEIDVEETFFKRNLK